MSLKPLSSYSKDQIDELKKFSSVWSHYTEILKHTAHDLSAELRKQRHEAWLQCAAAEYFKTASCREICLFWSDTAKRLIDQTYKIVASEFPQTSLAVFAFGKLGAGELNLSSDIDIMLVANNENSQQTPFLRRFQSLLSEVTDFGFAFRCDFDLRPGGRMGPLIPTAEQLKDYYGNYGEAWERLAFIRLSPLAGDPSVITEVEAFSEKFIYRKHLDYTLLSDLKNLRQRIHSANWHRTTDRQIDLKLGPGGIRDLELFTHTLLVIHGGKDLHLRVKQTDETLRLLCEKEILPQADCDFLIRHYWHLRRLENLVQAQADQQTHLLKEDSPLTVDRSKLQQEMQRCYQLVSTLLGEIDKDSKSLPETEEEQLTWLKSLGFQDQVKDVWKDLISTSVLSRQKERDELYRKRFLYLFLQQLSHCQRKETALVHLRDFLKATRAKATFYSLLLTHEKLIAQLVQVFVTSPYLSQVLCQRPELIDSFVLRTHEEFEAQDTGEILTHLLEKKYLSELISGSDFLVDQNLSQLMKRSSTTADEIAHTLLQSLAKEYGDHQVDLLCLGKWGGFELGLKSDLDFICVTGATDPTELDLKIARRFVNRLTENHQRGGSLYAVDLRLRPQGQSGVIVTSVDHLLEYLSSQAHAWERQAYLRARFLNQPQLSEKIHRACISRKLSSDDLKELNRIRTELLKTNTISDSSKIDLKYSEGGFADLELAIQAALLSEQSLPTGASFSEHVESLRTCTPSERHQFIDSWRLMRQAEQLYQALSTESVSVLEPQSQAFVLTAEILKLSSLELNQRLRLALHDNVTLLKRLDPRRSLS